MMPRDVENIYALNGIDGAFTTTLYGVTEISINKIRYTDISLVGINRAISSSKFGLSRGLCRSNGSIVAMTASRGMLTMRRAIS